MWHRYCLMLTVVAAAFAAEISSSYSSLDKNTSFKPDLKTEPLDQVFTKAKDEPERHPVYNAEERRARIEPVRPIGAIVKHDMLADQAGSTEVNRVDNLAIPNYGYVPVQQPVEVAYPDVAYAPGYGYDPGYASTNGFDVYGNSHGNYLIESDPTIFGLLWSQVPDSRTIINYTGRTIVWLINSFFVLLVGSFVTVGVCSYTNLCSFTFHGVGPIHEEMRSLVTPERLEKISTAADFVKNAIDKYQKIQKVSAMEGKREKRGVFYREF